VLRVVREIDLVCGDIHVRAIVAFVVVPGSTAGTWAKGRPIRHLLVSSTHETKGEGESVGETLNENMKYEQVCA
jgi:hypothetical protein